MIANAEQTLKIIQDIKGDPYRERGTGFSSILNNVPATAPQLRLIARAANAEGDVANAYFYMSYYYATIGNLPLAIGQVRMALETPNSNEVDQARFRSRLHQLIEYLPDEQRHLATSSQ